MQVGIDVKAGRGSSDCNCVSVDRYAETKFVALGSVGCEKLRLLRPAVPGTGVDVGRAQVRVGGTMMIGSDNGGIAVDRYACPEKVVGGPVACMELELRE